MVDIHNPTHTFDQSDQQIISLCWSIHVSNLECAGIVCTCICYRLSSLGCFYLFTVCQQTSNALHHDEAPYHSEVGCEAAWYMWYFRATFTKRDKSRSIMLWDLDPLVPMLTCEACKVGAIHKGCYAHVRPWSCMGGNSAPNCPGEKLYVDLVMIRWSDTYDCHRL